MELTSSTVWIALGLTMIAGMSTGIGSFMAFFAKSTNTKFLSAALGLSGGVMVYVSFMDLLPGSLEVLADSYTPKMASLILLVAFFAGITLITIIDFFIPEDENPHVLFNRPTAIFVLAQIHAVSHTVIFTVFVICVIFR